MKNAYSIDLKVGYKFLLGIIVPGEKKPNT